MTGKFLSDAIVYVALGVPILVVVKLVVSAAGVSRRSGF